MTDNTSVYVVRFRAREMDEPPPSDPSDSLRSALQSLPGIDEVHGATFDPGNGVVTGEFTLTVERGIGDAARDGARFAKEALKSADLHNSRIIGLWLELREPEGAGT